MTKEQMQIATAEAMGWKWATHVTLPNEEPDPDICLWYTGDTAIFHHLPNYPEDLNAMHEVEKKLSNNEYFRYDDLLAGIVSENCQSRIPKFPEGILIRYMEESPTSATAAQRCEAFLRVKGLWK